MIKKLITKSKFNIYSSLRHGTVAAATLIFSGLFFGSDNVMIAFPIALTSVVAAKQNVRIKTLSKYLTLLLVDIAIVLTAFLAGRNMYAGIAINFGAIFLIAYMLVSPYEMTSYRPFIMLYVFTQFARVPASGLLKRLLCVIMGVTFVFVANCVKGSDDRSILKSSIKKTFTLLKEYAKKMAGGTKDDSLIEDAVTTLNKLTYRVYISRHKKYLTTELGRHQFELMVMAENLAFTLNDIDYFTSGQWEEAGEIYGALSMYADGKVPADVMKKKLEEIGEIDERDGRLKRNLKGIFESLEKLGELEKHGANKVYDKWERTDFDRPNVIFVEYFHSSSLRFKFAVRMAVTLSVTMFLGELLGYYKIIWSIVTILSVMYHYHEDTVVRIKDRMAGNVIAIMFVGLIINVSGARWITMVILIISLFLLYGFKEYYKISLFSAIASLCIASLTRNVNVILIYRIVYVLIGGIIVYLANRFIYPYHTVDGLKDMTAKILRYNAKLIDDVEHFEAGKREEHEIRDLVIHIILLGDKLHIRNSQHGDKNIEEFIKHNNRFVIRLAYKTLI